MRRWWWALIPALLLVGGAVVWLLDEYNREYELWARMAEK